MLQNVMKQGRLLLVVFNYQKQTILFVFQEFDLLFFVVIRML